MPWREVLPPRPGDHPQLRQVFASRARGYGQWMGKKETVAGK
jgi:hypothetical protein